ncbi:unnamed protein product [Meloidogyne enterolobii]|uniref:Uncharacterized protein n=1 Tax=Meloidogyne enterolobii TaxID=390850 RepID=A0ACB1A1X1_MELEN
MDDIRDQPGLCSRFFSSLGVYQYYLDRLTPYTSIRWVRFLFFKPLGIGLFLWGLLRNSYVLVQVSFTGSRFHDLVRRGFCPLLVCLFYQE